MFAFKIDEETELRLHEEHHADDLFALTDRNRARLQPWFPWVESTQDVDDTLEFIKRIRRGYAENTVVPVSVWFDGNIAGTLSVFGIDAAVGSGEVGYWLGAEFEGRGIMTRCCRALISYAFDALGLNRIALKCQPTNTRSSAIAKRLDFTYEGTLRESAKHNGALHDMDVYSVLRREWSNSSS